MAVFFRGWYIYEHNPTSSDIIYLTEFWNLFNFVILMSCIGVMWEKKKKHKNYSIPLKEPETVLINNFDAKLVRLSVSEIELTFPNDYVMEEGKEYEIKDQNGSKTKITVVEQKKENILAKINEPLSKDNIRFVFGNSQRWQNVYHSYVKHFSKIPVGLYILMKSFKNCWSITRSYFKFVLAAFILSGVATTNAATYEQPLNELKHHDYTYFNNVLGSSNLPFYVSPRWNIDSAKMVIEYEKTAKLKDENITFSPETLQSIKKLTVMWV